MTIEATPVATSPEAPASPTPETVTDVEGGALLGTK